MRACKQLVLNLAVFAKLNSIGRFKLAVWYGIAIRTCALYVSARGKLKLMARSYFYFESMRSQYPPPPPHFQPLTND